LRGLFISSRHPTLAIQTLEPAMLRPICVVYVGHLAAAVRECSAIWLMYAK
jgi:hypothetical protein